MAWHGVTYSGERKGKNSLSIWGWILSLIVPLNLFTARQARWGSGHLLPALIEAGLLFPQLETPTHPLSLLGWRQRHRLWRGTAARIPHPMAHDNAELLSPTAGDAALCLGTLPPCWAGVDQEFSLHCPWSPLQIHREGLVKPFCFASLFILLEWQEWDGEGEEKRNNCPTPLP